MNIPYAEGRLDIQNRARQKGICSRCYKNKVEINPKTGFPKWLCKECNKKWCDWQRNKRTDKKRNGPRDRKVREGKYW